MVVSPHCGKTNSPPFWPPRIIPFSACEIPLAPGIRHFLKSDTFRYISVYLLFYLSFYAYSGSHVIAVLTTIFLFGPFLCGLLVMQFFEIRATRYLIFVVFFAMAFNLYFIYTASSVSLTQKLGQAYIYIDGKITLAGLAYNTGVSLMLCIGLLAANSAISLMVRRI
jgi:hypothetical protein